MAKDLGLGETTLRRIDQIATEYEASSELGDRETLLADSRYRFVERVVRSSVKRRGDGGQAHHHRAHRRGGQPTSTSPCPCSWP